MAKRKTRGVKRKADRERYPSGGVKHRRQGVDRGTVETQLRRATLVHDGDRSKAAYPLGVLFANGTITESQHLAGCHLAWLYAAVFGRVSLAAVDYERGRTEPEKITTPEDRKKLELERQSELNRLLSVLESPSRRVRESVVEVAVFEVMPRWALPCVPRFNDVVMAQLFLKGIQILEGASMASRVMLTARRKGGTLSQ